MEALQKHHHIFPRKVTSRTILTLHNISFYIQNVTQLNAVNENNYEKIKGYHYVYLKILIDYHFFCCDICWIDSLKHMVSNTVLALPKFNIFYENHSSTQLHKIFFEKVRSTLGEHFLDTHHKKSCCVLKSRKQNPFQ